MISFENISINNGWAMAATGYSIVLAGLAILALIISQLHRIIALFDKKSPTEPPDDEGAHTDIAAAETDILKDPAAAACIYRPLTTSLGKKFELSSLYELFKQENIAHPHLTIRMLRETGHIVALEECYFCWKAE